MRVCHPGPVAFHRANVSGGSRRLIATFGAEDFGRPLGLSMAAAVRAPNILGNTSLAGRASAIIAAVHSGFLRTIFLDLDGFFITTCLALVGLTQTDHSGLSFHARQDQSGSAKKVIFLLIHRSSGEAARSHQIPLSQVLYWSLLFAEEKICRPNQRLIPERSRPYATASMLQPGSYAPSS